MKLQNLTQSIAGRRALKVSNGLKKFAAKELFYLNRKHLRLPVQIVNL